MVTAACLLIDALGALSKRRQDKERFTSFLDIVETLPPSRCRAHRGRQDVTPSSERVFPTRPRSFEGVGCPMGVAVTIAGGGDGLFFFLFFFNHLL